VATLDAQPAPLSGVAEELAEINRQQSSNLAGGAVLRQRAGENGLSRLMDVETPLEGRIRAGNGQLVVTATPVMLDAGTATNSASTRARFGAGFAQSSSPADIGAQSASGVGLSVGYSSRSLQADVGVTPIGFRERNVVGGLQYNGNLTDQTSYSLAVTRRAVTDSLLSYAGARDASAGLEWGGVTANSARATLGWDDGTSGLYANGQFQYLDGHHVQANYAGKIGGGFYGRVYNDANQTLTVGLNTTLMRYTKNQSYFTYGQGGYFSPQQYIIVNLPIEYIGRNGAFTYAIKNSIGIQHYHLNAASYFPLDPGRQQAAAANMASKNDAALDANAVYPGQSKTGLAYSLALAGEYQLSPRL
ncbi:cellulose synthase subunit BcsC-related outer membrane protein, partial [Burkholderia ubonensis]|uniref:cellulose synthase subunit BcsC-related outer membrane protein n=1 Tax=Burkholderia ubonensis TaxID=101571 RepID=UPI000AF281E0